MSKIFFFLYTIPLITCAQLNIVNSVNFRTGLSWDQIKDQAKNENKYIFLDCYATWCGPCKRMDKEIYTDENVARIVNQYFISVKVQMDTTADDNAEIQEWYAVANELNKKYQIPGFPSYLFFTSNGELIHKDMGYKNSNNFIALISDVLNPSTQLKNILQQFENGNNEPEFLKKVAKAAKKLGYYHIADSVAHLYKSQYLNKLDDKALFNKNNIQFVTHDFSRLFYEDGSLGRLFKKFFQSPEQIDSIMGKGFADFFVDAVITEEELLTKLFQKEKLINKNPQWVSLKSMISTKYGADRAEKIISNYKLVFYRYTQDWEKWATLFDEKIGKCQLKQGSNNLSSLGDDWVLNDNAWTLFQNCSSEELLHKALKWSKLSIRLKKHAKGIEQYLDTKANLEYKLGHVKKAVKIEKRALVLNNKFKKDGTSSNDFSKEFSENIEKMKRGQPTWN